MDMTLILNTVIWAGLGIIVLIVSFIILDLLTPGKLWEEIEQKQNVAVAIFAGAIALSLAIIVAASVHG